MKPAATPNHPADPAAPIDPLHAHAQQSLRQMTGESRALQPPADVPITDTIAGWLAAQYATLARDGILAATGPRRLKIMRAFVRDWHLLRGGDQAAGRLQLGRDSLAWRRENGLAQKEQQFREWRKRPENRIPEPRKGGITRETLEKIERELGLFDPYPPNETPDS